MIFRSSSRILLALMLVSMGCGDDTSGSGAEQPGGSPAAGGGGAGASSPATGGAGAGPVLGGMGGSGGTNTGGEGGFAGAGGGSGPVGAGGVGGTGGTSGGGGGEGGEGGGGVVTLEDPCGGFPDPNVLVDVGYPWAIPNPNATKPTIMIEGDRILAGGILWDSESRTQILPAGTGRQLAGDRVLGEGGLYDAVTGSLITGFAAQEPMGMTPDGDFAFYRDAAGLHVIDANGAPLLDWPGNYATSFVNIQSDELRIGNGDAGAGVVERVTFAGVQTLIPFTGTFHSWFREGNRFITLSAGNVVRIYDVDGVQEHLWPLSTAQGLAGMGDYFWTFSGTGNLTVFEVGAPNPGVTTAEGYIEVTQTGLGSRKSAGDFDIIVPGVGRTSFSTGVNMESLTAVGADASGNWVVGTVSGIAVRHGTPSDSTAEGYLGCGAVTGIGGTLSGRVAVATKTGQLLVFSLSPAGDKTLEKVIPIELTDDMEMSEDGAWLMAVDVGSSVQEVLLDLNSETTTTLSLPDGQNGPIFDFSDAGDMLSSSLGVGTPANPVSYWAGSGSEPTPPCVSPAGNGDFTVAVGFLPNCTTTFFNNGVPVNTVSKCAMGWVGPDRVMTQSFTAMGPSWIGNSGEIYDAAGNFVASTPVVFNVGTAVGGPFCPFEPALGTNLTFVRHQRRLIDYTTGAVQWQASTLTESADRVGAFIAWEDGARVRLVPY